ncbi:2-dehydro-3-deoxygluconokinase [Paenibacillus pectinilyticus]|uniref:2-dehydro-3-deoxygluconokinase n=1 Tax=Paenibacillus pectinilyticus TaxID=512399 RepID=A0A1C0ZRS1_9BACL|nr:sugar kinase [Paenibacillus pectinilyticus]OCT10767.1 2-dehydro-3-deoxygluconokinase [Paenibacillus pectinilyticus]
MKSMDVVTFGESMVLFTPARMLPLAYENQYYRQMAGAESNVAIGVSRLGHSVGWFSKLGRDPFGEFIYKSIQGEGIDVSRCTYSEEAPTGLFFKEKRSSGDVRIYYYRRHSAASMLQPEDLDEDYILRAKYLHITGITPALSKSCRETVYAAIEIAGSNGVTIVFDPNLRLKLWHEDEARRVLSDIAQKSHIILPGMDEGMFLTGEHTREAIATKLTKGGKTVIMKLGKEGAFYQNEDENGVVPGFLVQEVVDPVGAGDGFSAGILSGLLRDEPLPKVVRRANAIGALVVGVNGDSEGLPKIEEVEQFMSRSSSTQDVSR